MKAHGSKRSVGILVAAVTALVVLPQPVRAQEIDFTNTVTVAAGASVEMPADEVSVGFGVRETGPTATDATRALAASTQAVVDALRAAGVGQGDELSVGSVRLGRRTDRFDNFIEYVASSSVRVKTGDLDALGEIIDAGVAGGADSVSGLRYSVSDRTAAVEQALVEAMKLARKKATILATTDGRTVGKAIMISEFDSRPPRAVAVRGTRSAGGATADAASFIPTEPPILDAQARITVTFELI
ncbi:MAG TPA: SIMPL domain-containing protein [Actinomycetota bacterium]|nr:SIMPL domain-containing protein [Actinomycetota bacterium]